MSIMPINMEKTFAEDEIIVSKTDLKGKITYGNELFIKMSGYTEDELLGANHNIVRHPDMPKIVFKTLWDTVQGKKEIFAYVKNMAKDGSFYWVFANVTPSLDLSGNIIGYYSVRRKPSKKAIETIEPIYKALLDAEKRGGMKESQKLLEETLHNANICYEQFVLSI
ncbi:MAG: PAS domain-containing protein [Campylobacterales bacterium]|nr:PAS domain-containing protein [Campylobacterales bacterium]